MHYIEIQDVLICLANRLEALEKYNLALEKNIYGYQQLVCDYQQSVLELKTRIEKLEAITNC